jgi:hypothetical protein
MPRRITLFGLIFLSGCFNQDYRPLEVALGAAAAVGHTSRLAMAAMRGPTACATPKKVCLAFPCDGEFDIDLSDACPIPLGGAASGKVTVSGRWTTRDKASFGAIYQDVRTSDGEVVVKQSTGISASYASMQTTLSYVGQNVQTGGSVTVGQSTWTITAGDDGTYEVSATQQGVAGAGVTQLSVSSTRISPSCQLNPVSGSAVIQEVGGLSIRNDVLHFHSTCDGKADNGATLRFVDD